mgnify:CR=1 FL=1
MFLFYNFEIESIVYAVAEKRGESRRDKEKTTAWNHKKKNGQIESRQYYN